MKHPVNRMRPVHPGEILREDYLVPLGMSAHALAVALNVPATRVHEIVNERRASPPTQRNVSHVILAAMQCPG
jgi:antitoxin HigA-1